MRYIFPGVVPLRGQIGARCRRGHRVGGGARIRRRNGQRPDTRPVGPASADQLRRGPAVLVHGGLVVGQLHDAGRGVRVRHGHVQRAVIDRPARIAVLPDDGGPVGRGGQLFARPEELHG